MLTMADFRGGSQTQAPVANFFLRPQLRRLIIVNTSTPSLKGKLPQATRYSITGGEIAVIFNIGVAFDVVNWSDTVIGTLATNKVGVILLTDNTTDNGAWYMLKYDRAT